ncbi:hypothetical protein BDZ90DRAFT_223191 [Jaminaea rosea]|uniref:Uncharacterized protein n=1 Tax=Jaminaea rosea TaxID=1569628 RepID=A0A316UJZ4_9BASI|nr:hypothetical protein BDZ90DRAFT_223191 [Jaminaea rosea]PWN25612.1 hypothetical protein BDZ90DRAFT_223191 [Jaminaea rosea]
MSTDPTSSFIESAAWTSTAEPTADEVIEKQNLIKEILSSQESLKALVTRVQGVQADCTKAEADNEMLQSYVESVTKSLAAKGAQ